MPDHKLRIGEAARRLGMSPEILRAWELRYGIPTPERTAGGLRLYSAGEIERTGRMRDLVESGLAPAEAARAVVGEQAATQSGEPSEGLAASAAELRAHLDRFDDDAAQRSLDALLARFSADVVVNDVVLPYLTELGERWAIGDVSVAQEHFASTLLRGRLLALGRGWDRGSGPRAVLAAPAGELHDIGLIAFGLSLRTHGWRITYLGQNTPGETLVDAVMTISPQAVVLAAGTTELLRAPADELRRLPTGVRVLFGGRGARADAGLPGQVLPLDPIEAALQTTVPE